MRNVIANRFNVIKTLRNDRAAHTFVASDLWSDGMKVLLKVYRSKYVKYDQPKINQMFSVFTGLRHPHIAPILEAGWTKSRDLWLVRQYIEFESLNPPDVEHIRRLIATILCLNAAGYVHGGIKPTNVLLAKSDLRLVDPSVVNIIKNADSWDEIRFTAPEVLRGANPSPDSDLYSVGALLHRWIVGQDAFDDSELSLLKLKYLWASPQGSVRSEHVSPDVAQAACGLLCKDTGRRLAAFQALVDLLKIEKLPADRAPFVGHSAVFSKLRAAVSNGQKRTLHTIVLDGAPGIGKSRLVEQLSVSCSLDNVNLAICRWADSTCSSLQSLLRAVKRLIRDPRFINTLKQNLAGFSNTLSRCLDDEDVMHCRLP